MKEPPQAQYHTNDDGFRGETHKKGGFSVEVMSDLPTGPLRELHEAIDRSSIVGCKLFTPEFRAGCREESLFSSRPTVNSTGNFNEFRESITWLINEFRTWKSFAALESEKRRQVEGEVDRLKKNVQEAQMNKKGLERHVQEWKLVAEQADAVWPNTAGD